MVKKIKAETKQNEILAMAACEQELDDILKIKYLCLNLIKPTWTHRSTHPNSSSDNLRQISNSL